jgi:hypothetical protein
MGNSCSANVAVREEAHIKGVQGCDRSPAVDRPCAYWVAPLAASEAAAAALHAAETVPQPPEVQDAGTLLLRHFNLEVYLPAFQIAGYTRIEQLLQLSAQDLDAIEQRSHVPILPAHRRLMLSEIWTAWAQVRPEQGAALASILCCPPWHSTHAVCRHLQPIIILPLADKHDWCMLVTSRL